MIEQLESQELDDFISLCEKCIHVDQREGYIITTWTSQEILDRLLKIKDDFTLQNNSSVEEKK